MICRSNFIATIFLVLACAAVSVHAGLLEKYSYVFKGKLVSVPIGEFEGVRYNDVCLKAPDRCEALKNFRKPAQVKTSDVETLSSDYCRVAGGSPLLLTSSRGGGSLFCVFKDLSMVDARALSAQAARKAGTK